MIEVYMQNFEGQSIGRYHIIEPLGEGGMAVVYKAYDTHLECEVAVKVIRTENLPQSGVERALKRFEREAKAVARLTHPNIVKVTDYGEEDGKPYLVMPFLPGGTLKQLIKERGQIPWQEAARILIPIAEALAYAHDEKVIHRDIKPSNILLTRSGQPMLTDFGVAKIIEDEATQDLTGTSATVGTPEYMAPEQITSKTVDARADLYSLGVVFYEMITGRKPFEADTPLAVLFKHASDPLPRPSQFVPDLPEKVEQFLFKTLAKDVKDRYQSSDELCQGLRGLSDAKGGSSQSNKSESAQKTSTQNSSKRKVNKWIIIGAAVLVLLVGSYLLGSLRKNPPAATEEPQASETIATTEVPTIEATATETATATLTPTITLTPTLELVTLTIPDGNEVNCRNVSNEVGAVLKIFKSDEQIIVNGMDETGYWINIKIDPVTARTGDQVSDCWIYKSSTYTLSSDRELAVIESRPIYTVYSILIQAWGNSYSPNVYKSFYGTYYDFSSESKANEFAQSQCVILKSKGATRCYGYAPKSYFSDLWVLKNPNVWQSYY